MTQLPTSAQLAALVAALRRQLLDLDARAATGRRRLPGNAARLEAAVARNRMGRATRDGYPAGGDGAGAGEHRSTVEAAALARQPADPIHDATTRAVAELRRAVAALDAVAGHLDRIDAATRAAGETVDVVECECHRRAGLHASDGVIYTDVGGALPRAMRLCRACYGYARDVKRGKRRATDGELLPSPEQVRHHDTTGRWRIRTPPSN